MGIANMNTKLLRLHQLYAQQNWDKNEGQIQTKQTLVQNKKKIIPKEKKLQLMV